MKRIKLDTAAPSVKRFIRALRLGPDGIELELAGQVLCKVIPAAQLTDAEKTALVQKAWELVRQARERNKDVSSRVIDRDVRDAVNAVRGRGR